MASIPYADVRSRELQPIDARDICTKVTLVVAGRPSGREPYRQTTRAADNTVFTHYPVPLTVSVEADDHAVYHAHKVVQLPDGTNPFLDPTDAAIPDPIVMGGVGASPTLRDGDPDTSVTVTVNDALHTSDQSTAALVVYTGAADGAAEMFGFRIMYSFNVSGEHEATAMRSPSIFGEKRIDSGAGIVVSHYFWELPYTQAETTVTDLWATIHADARANPTPTTRLDRYSVLVNGVQGSLVITHFYPLVLNTEYLESVARSHLRLPASAPSRITVSGLVPLEDTHTIVGWPGGDLVIPVARQTFVRDETIIEVEQRSAPRGLAASTAEAASIRAQREAQARARDLYAVRMAGR